MLRDNYENVKEYINGKLGSINDSDYILLDVEEADKIDDLLEIVFEYKLRNVTPIIVSPEKIKEIIFRVFRVLFLLIVFVRQKEI